MFMDGRIGLKNFLFFKRFINYYFVNNFFWRMSCFWDVYMGWDRYEKRRVQGIGEFIEGLREEI